MTFAKEKICFHYLVSPFYFPNRTKVKVFIEGIFREHRLSIQTINYIFCSDDYLLSINKKHLKHNYYTDIITFDLSDGLEFVADIFISVDRAIENSSAYNVSKLSEIQRLIIHGALHLCGYKDKSDTTRRKMKRMEDHYLAQLVSRETSAVLTHRRRANL